MCECNDKRGSLYTTLIPQFDMVHKVSSVCLIDPCSSYRLNKRRIVFRSEWSTWSTSPAQNRDTMCQTKNHGDRGASDMQPNLALRCVEIHQANDIETHGTHKHTSFDVRPDPLWAGHVATCDKQRPLGQSRSAWHHPLPRGRSHGDTWRWRPTWWHTTHVWSYI
jgi:hypothetical protein